MINQEDRKIPKPVPRGLFISFEGTEGAGKSTQVNLLAERLRAEGRTVLCLREPGGTPIGEEIRHTLQHSQDNQNMAPETELLLMNASRAQLVREVIRPALESGQIVLCDRFYDSTVAYQGAGRGLRQEDVDLIINFAVGDTKPDMTIYLRIPLSMSEARRRKRESSVATQRDRMEEEKGPFFQRVEAGFTQQCLREPERIKTVDGTGAVGDVHGEIWKMVGPYLR